MATLTATPDAPSGAVDLAATGLSGSVNIVRIDALGVVLAVRNADPAVLSGGSWTGQDFEGPLDELVTYEARNAATGSALATSSAVTLASNGKFWLVHPGHPELSITPVVAALNLGARKARSVALDVLGRALPLGQSLARSAFAGTLSVRISTGADLAALNTILDDGHVLVLRAPGSWIGYRYRYIQVGDVDFDQLIRVPDGRFTVSLPWVEVTRPAGIADTTVTLVGAGSAYLDTTLTLTSAGAKD